MGKILRKPSIIYILIAILILLLDLFTKNMAEKHLAEKEITLLPFLHLVLVYNKGVAFGILSDAPDIVRLPVLLITPILALIITFVYTIKSKKVLDAMLMGMVGGGALGNFYDRLFLGSVRDFIYLSYGGLSWPAFNVADASIGLAIVMFILQALLKR